MCDQLHGATKFQVNFYWVIPRNYRVTQKNENFWKTQQKLKKSKKKSLLTEIEPLQLAF